MWGRGMEFIDRMLLIFLGFCGRSVRLRLPGLRSVGEHVVEILVVGLVALLVEADKWLRDALEPSGSHYLVVVSPSFARIGRYVADTLVTGNHWKTVLPEGPYDTSSSRGRACPGWRKYRQG